MRHQLLEVERERFDLSDPRKYLIRGVIPEKYTIEAYMDGTPLKVETTRQIAKSAVERYKDGELLGGQRVGKECAGGFKKQEKAFGFRRLGG